MSTRRPQPASIAGSAFAGFCFPPDVIVLAVGWYLRVALSYRDVEELLAERGVKVAGRWRYVYRRPPGTGPIGMPTTESRPTTAGCKRGLARCEDSNRTAVPGS